MSQAEKESVMSCPRETVSILQRSRGARRLEQQWVFYLATHKFIYFILQVMIKNIPNKMSDKNLIDFINDVCPRKVDFLYLRM